AVVAEAGVVHRGTGLFFEASKNGFEVLLLGARPGSDDVERCAREVARRLCRSAAVAVGSSGGVIAAASAQDEPCNPGDPHDRDNGAVLLHTHLCVLLDFDVRTGLRPSVPPA